MYMCLCCRMLHVTYLSFFLSEVALKGSGDRHSVYEKDTYIIIIY